MIKVATVFSGIGAVEFALKRLNKEHEIIFACDNGNIEIDYDTNKEMETIRKMKTPFEKKQYVDYLYSKSRKTNFVKQSYLANYEIDENRYYQDVKLLDGTDYKGDIDLFVGGSPCQSFSTVGFTGGLEDARGTLFYEFARLVKEIQPKVFIYENVRGLLTHDNGKTWKIIKGIFDGLGYVYYYDVLNAKDYGVPQNRRRLFVVGFKKDVLFKFPSPIALDLTMQDFLIEKNTLGSINYNENGKLTFNNDEGVIDDKYYLSEKLYNYVMKGGTKTFYTKPEIDLSVARTILATMGNRHRAGVDNYVTIDGKVRMLSEREAHRLMGFTDDYKIVVSRAQSYKQAGNSIVVDVLMKILIEIYKTNIF